MPTSDERREVASVLRGNPNDTLIPQSRDGFEGMTYHEAAWRFWNMCRRVRGAANADIAYSTTSALADLIDPTCRIVYVDESYSTPEVGRVDDCYYECSRCCYELSDGEMYEVESGALPFRYCPNCGARVVSGDE